MPARQSTHTLRAVNATTFETSILDLIGAGLAPLPRVELAAVEIRIRDAEQTTTLVLRAGPGGGQAADRRRRGDGLRIAP